MTAGEQPPVDMAWSWRHLDNERAQQLWDELIDWVSWLRVRYQLPSYGTLPGCWWRHPVAVEELTALMCAHKGAYRADAKPDDYRGELSSWHHYDLWPCLERLPKAAGFTACTPHQCDYTPVTPDEYPGLSEHIAADLAGRPDPAPPDDTSADDGAAGEVLGESVMPADAMARALASGLAEPLHPNHPERAVRFDGRIWLLHPGTGTYRPALPPAGGD